MRGMAHLARTRSLGKQSNGLHGQARPQCVAAVQEQLSMSSVLDTIRRVLGRDRGNRPDPAAQTDAGAPVRAGTAEGVMPPAAGEPALAMPGEEAEAPIQATAPPAPPAMPASPPAAAKPPVAVSAAMETTEVESEAEPIGPQSDATAEPHRQGNVQDRPLPAPV